MSIMLWNRCYAIGARRVAPDALLGMYETSEWADAQNTYYKIDENNEPVPAEGEPEWLRS